MNTKEEILDKHFSMKDREIEKWKVLAAMEEYAAQFKDSPYQGSAGVWRSAAKPPGITQWYVVKCEQRRFASLIYVDSKITLERVAKDIDVEIDLLEWLDSAASPAGDGWMSEKPEFKSECTFLTATRIFRSDKWNYSVWSIAKIEGDDGWYLGIVDGTGDEWGDIEDLTADMYLILPSPPNKSV